MEAPYERTSLARAAAESFFRSRLTNQRNASPSTVASYRDALRMLVLFVAERAGRKPSALDVADFDRDLVLAFPRRAGREAQELDSDAKRAPDGDPILFPSCGGERPASLGIAQRILAIPLKRTHIEVTHHLSRNEVDALINAPDQRTPRGRRDRALLLFLARTGARVSEAIGVNAGDLQLDRPRSQVLGAIYRRGSCRYPRDAPPPRPPRRTPRSPPKSEPGLLRSIADAARRP